MSHQQPMRNSFILTDVLIFTGDEFIEKGYVEVEEGKIKGFGSGDFPHTSTTEKLVISKAGCTLLPGLIDSHIHGLGGNVLSIEQSLRFGVTTVCDMHNEPQQIAKLKQLAARLETKNIYADPKCAGTAATIRGGWPEGVYLLHDESAATKSIIDSWPKLTKPSEAEAFVKEQITTSGASYIKLMHELGDSITVSLLAVGHAFSFQGAVDLLSCGVDGLTHSFIDKPTSNQHIELAKRNNAHHNPTLTVCASQTREGDEIQVKFHNDPLAKRMLFDTTPRQPLGLGNDESRVENAYQCTKDMYEAGIPMIVGSDSSGQARGSQFGLGVHMEIHAMVHKAGIEVIDVLKGATSLIADRFRFHDRGRIVVGRKADLVLVEGDVRKFLAKEENLCLPICGVWRDGIVAKVYEEVVDYLDISLIGFE
ncbi:hypothetical protein N431DRAFT_458622 [Stipitochalara longipes BDJ]|nr:hypothetical protein N431DRAFT_458622 [Stipitochalara longipes BDJ]